MTVSIKVDIDAPMYLRDPQETKLGRNIIRYSIDMIDELGLESFTFKKLAEQIGCTEASVYRYFENKHALLVYLVSWYWEWLRHRLNYNTMNISEAGKKLRIVIKTIIDTIQMALPPDYIDREALHRIVITEGSKAYHSKAVDEENQKGHFETYKRLCQEIADIIKEVNPTFPYPQALSSNLLEMANHYTYFAQHIPALTDITLIAGNLEPLEALLNYFAFKLLGNS